MAHLWKAIKASGGDVNAATHLHEWVFNNPMFEDVVYREFWLPVVPARRDSSNDSEHLRRLHQGLSDDCLVGVTSTFLFLLALSHPYTRLSFDLVVLSFWGMVLHQKSLAYSRRIASRSSKKDGPSNSPEYKMYTLERDKPAHRARSPYSQTISLMTKLCQLSGMNQLAVCVRRFTATFVQKWFGKILIHFLVYVPS